MRTRFITSQLAILFLSVGILIAQTDKSLKEKVKNIKGDINSITISTSEGNVTFEGKDAQKLFKKMKTKTLQKKFKFISKSSDDFDDGNDMDILLLKNSNLVKVMEDGKQVNINVEDENGEKKVTVTTNENGKEIVKTYEGKDAEKYLKENKNLHHFSIDVDDTNDGKLLIYTDDDDVTFDTDIDIKVIDGVKKVTVITNTNGDENIEVYEGEDAEKFLEEMDEEDGNIKLLKKIKGSKKIKKIIIKKVEEDEK